MSLKFSNINILKRIRGLNNFFRQNYCSFSNNGIQERKCDIVVVGGGIIGTSIARKLKMDHHELKIYLLEKECALAKHQSSHNSGVMHSGVYYQSESLKSKLCVEGIDLLQEYCDDKKVKYKKCGKLVVAKDCSEVPILEELLQRGSKNKVKDLELLESPCDITKIAPGCRGIKALWCPHVANVNFKEVTQHFAKDFEDLGGKIVLNMKVINMVSSDDCVYPVCIIPEDEIPILAKYAITCGGLQSETLTKLVNEHSLSKNSFLALRVDYHKIQSKYCDGVETNIYAVPDLSLPFLGAHFSPRLDDTVLLGPSAILAVSPEGYCDEVNLKYLTKILTSCSLRNFILRNFFKCVNQTSKAVCSEVQIKYLQELVPNFSYQFVQKGPTAVQCQLVNDDGTVVDDFVFEFFKGKGIGRRIINIKFAPSPAATSSMAIANYVVNEFTRRIL